MKGMEAVVALRRAGKKPRSVLLSLVPAGSVQRMPDVDFCGTCHVDVWADESLADLDLRPLTGLQVQLIDCADDGDRHRRLAKLVADVEPLLLAMPILGADGSLVLHRRWGANEHEAAWTETTRVAA